MSNWDLTLVLMCMIRVGCASKSSLFDYINNISTEDNLGVGWEGGGGFLLCPSYSLSTWV